MLESLRKFVFYSSFLLTPDTSCLIASQVILCSPLLMSLSSFGSSLLFFNLIIFSLTSNYFIYFHMQIYSFEYEDIYKLCFQKLPLRSVYVDTVIIVTAATVFFFIFRIVSLISLLLSEEIVNFYSDFRKQI